jgi:hypothetical protein
MCFFDTDSLSLAIIRAKILPHKIWPPFSISRSTGKKMEANVGKMSNIAAEYAGDANKLQICGLH